MGALDDHADEAEPRTPGDVLTGDAVDVHDEHTGDEHTGDEHTGDELGDALPWARAFMAERNGDVADIMIDDVLAAARDDGVDEQGVRRALGTMGVKARRNGRLRQRSAAADVASPAAGTDRTRRTHVRRPNHTAAQDEALPAPAGSRSERQSNRAPGGRVRIVAVDLDNEGRPVDTVQPTSILVQIRCDEPGRLDVRVVIRDGQRGEVEAVAPPRDVTHPGLFALRCDIPANALGGLKHAVDVEAWLVTATERYASMHAYAQRFKSLGRGARRPFVRVDATWSEDSL